MSNPLLVEGVSDAVGFLGGALAGYGLARVLGLDPFSEGYDLATIVGIGAVGLGGGLGLQLARRWRLARRPKTGSDQGPP
ncbi:hypothetical protein [Macromonas nakdongensis]|jgi:hypothetical protein|uniref:hypothetical protein n=1 Tax=Macromonas nakdongensis TaxID=1843082 RepID=UPI000C334A52|nr:hypothetical protein [Macromonas nakdongensis]